MALYMRLITRNYFKAATSLNSFASTDICGTPGTMLQEKLQNVHPQLLDHEPLVTEGLLNHSYCGFVDCKTTVLMLGWGGAQDKMLQKYSKIYETQGCNVTRYISPLWKAPSLLQAHRFAVELNQHIVKLNATSQIVFHLFSMNAVLTFTALWELWAKTEQGQELKNRVTGIVFDSAPSDCLPSQSALALSLAVKPQAKMVIDRALRAAAYAMFYGYFLFQRMHVNLQSLIWPNRFSDYYSYYRLLQLNDLPKNQLYLYSNKDPIIDSDYVDKFIQHQQSTGASVVAKKWIDSYHVSHIRKHRDEYVQLCIEFIQKTCKA